MSNPIPQEELDSFLASVKAEMHRRGFRNDTISGTRIVAIHPEYWEVSIFVPYESTKVGNVRRAMENILFSVCGVEKRYCDYYGKRPEEKAYEWYFRHPHVPKDIAELIDEEMAEEQAEEECCVIPTPSGATSKSDVAFLSLKDEFFKAIQNGEKTTEYRNLNQYYCDKFFSPGVRKRFLKLNRGYQSGSENQMVFEIAAIVIVGSNGDEIPAFDNRGAPIDSMSQLPTGFKPVMYGIKLGNRIA